MTDRIEESPGAPYLSPQDREFVAEDQDLQILVGLGTATQRHQPEQPHEHHIEEGQEHEAGFSQTDRVATTGAPNRVFVPHGFASASPPRAAATRPARFTEGLVTFTRRPNPSDQPILCGCGRLVYLAEQGGGVSWWCPDHGYEVS